KNNNKEARRTIYDIINQYTPSCAITKLKQVIYKKLKKDNTLQYSPQQIIVTTGAKHTLYTLFQVILNEKDEVIVPAPYWVSYTEQVKLAGAKDRKSVV